MAEGRKNHLPVPLPVVSIDEYDPVAEEGVQHGDQEVLLVQARPVREHLLNQLQISREDGRNGTDPEQKCSPWKK
jgi:hypothetical protein